jgi:hypothetical protein
MSIFNRQPIEKMNPTINGEMDDYLLYVLISELANTHNIALDDNATNHKKNTLKPFAKLSAETRIYYTKYGSKLASAFAEYLPNIQMFGLSIDDEDHPDSQAWFTWIPEPTDDEAGDQEHDETCTYINFKYSQPVRDVIPKKLMRICKYGGNSNKFKAYREAYEEFRSNAYACIEDFAKYSEIELASRREIIFDPIIELVYNTLLRKRDRKDVLFEHLFPNPDAICVDLGKKKFTIYDFTTELGGDNGYHLKILKNGKLNIKFNNGCHFILTPRTNATYIAEEVSIKLHTTFKNVDELFVVTHATIN